jgi:hypothetical protein
MLYGFTNWAVLWIITVLESKIKLQFNCCDYHVSEILLGNGQQKGIVFEIFFHILQFDS